MPLNCKTLIGNFEVEHCNFELKLRNFKLKLQKYFNLVYFSNFVLLLGLLSKSQSLSKESVKQDPKNFMKFQTRVSKF